MFRLCIFLTSLFALLPFAGVSALAKDAPLQIVVSLKEQYLKVYQAGEVVAQSKISSGKRGHVTPTGIFSVLHKRRYHRSNIYSGAPMPYMQRLTWSGIALHASNSVPRYPASHGCVRLPNRFARQLFSMNTNGAHVVIEYEPGVPTKVHSPHLPQPQKFWTPDAENDPWVNAHIASSNAGFVLGRTDLPVRILFTRRTYKEDLFEVQRLLNKLNYDAGVVDGIMGPATWRAIAGFQTDNAMEATGKIDSDLLESLYEQAMETRPANGVVHVRQHQATIFTAPIEIEQPELPIGSHLLLATEATEQNGELEWMHMALNDRIHRKITPSASEKLDTSTAHRPLEKALSRLKMKPRVVRQIARLIGEGASISISDNGLSMETGETGTDFIVLTKPEHKNSLVASHTE